MYNVSALKYCELLSLLKAWILCNILFHCTYVFHNTAEEADFAFYATMERSYTVTFNNITSNQICVNVSLIDDDIAENSESFVVVLTAIDTDDTIGINSTNITIVDNDGKLNPYIWRVRRMYVDLLRFHGVGIIVED